MIPVPEDSADWGDTLQDLEFLALTDSTFQYMLTGDQYGARSLFGGQALICPGAALTQNYKRSGSITPSILELLSWQCLHICGHCPGGVPYSNPAVIGMLKDNLHKKVNVALIPIEDSIPEDRQDKLHFHTASAEAAIGALTVRGVTQTYMHDSKPEPSQMCRKYMPEMTRTFCDDEDLYNVLQSPAHRADLFRYVYLYEHGGLYLDIKCSLRMQFDELRSCLAEEWGTAQSYAHSALGHCPSPPGQLPKDYMVMVIGNRGDHHLSGHPPQHGWNISSRFGPIYLLRERHNKELLELE
ncbi:unnamed protein product, partial [Symbiodinium pilosum]